jgi:hypothetical protein
MWRYTVKSLGTVAVPGEWSIMLALYCSDTVAACLHALQALTAMPARTSCRPCQASWKLARVRWEHACLAAQAGLLGFSLCLRLVDHRETRDMWQRRSLPQLGGDVWSHRTCSNTGAQLSREVRSGAIGHVAALEPNSAGRRGPES